MAFVQFFIAQFSFPAKICLFLSATRKNSLQNFVDQSLYLDSGLITCADHDHDHDPLDQSKREFYAVHCINTHTFTYIIDIVGYIIQGN